MAIASVELIDSVEITRASVELPARQTSGAHIIDSIECVLVSVHAAGETGRGYAFCFFPHEAEAIEVMARSYVPSIQGQPVHLVRRSWLELWRTTNFIGHAGPPLMALSAFDMALWDLLAREAKRPLYRVLGAVRDELTVYYAAGWLSLDVDALCGQAVAARDAGYTAYKMRAGNPDWRQDVARIKAVREALGYETQLMVDVNQAWDVATAIRVARELEDVGLAWLEEPVDAHDVIGCAQVAAAVEVPIAAGETVWGPNGLVDLLRANAVDILQPDLMRCGGITGFLAAAAAADALGVTVVSHLYTPISAHLMATVARSDLVEYIPGWFDALFSAGPVIEGGKIRLGGEPGTGVVFASESHGASA